MYKVEINKYQVSILLKIKAQYMKMYEANQGFSLVAKKTADRQLGAAKPHLFRPNNKLSYTVGVAW